MISSERPQSEFVGYPQCYEVHIATGLSLFQERSREKVKILGCRADVATQLPFELKARMIANVASSAGLSGANQVARNAIDPISGALPPEKVEI